MKTIEVCGTVVTEEDIERVESPVLRDALKTRFSMLDGKLNEEISGCVCLPMQPGSNHPNYRAYKVHRR